MEELTVISSEKAEQSLLGSILIGGNAIYEKVSPWIRSAEAFYYRDNRLIWVALRELYHEDAPLDTISVFEYLKQKKKTVKAYYITGLMDTISSTSNVEYYAKIVWERYIQRETAKSAYKLYKVANNNSESTIKVLEEHARLVDEMMNLQPSKKKDVEDIIGDTIASIKTGNNIIPFGLSALDAPAAGGTRKEISVIGGRPGHGKSTLMVNMIEAVASQGFKVCVFSREMTNIEIMRKLIVKESKSLAYTDLRQNLIGTEEDFKNSTKLIKEKYKNVLFYENIKTLREAFAEINREKPDIVFDDYIQLIDPEIKTDRRFQIEYIMNEYKWLAKKENLHAVLISQLSREIEKRYDPVPKLSDFAEGAAIEQVAELAILMFYGYQFNGEKYSMYESNLIAAKSRYGKIGTYVVGFNGNRCSFYDTEDEAKSDEPKSAVKTPEWIHQD